jgi:glycerophosphoryl diester phosphodiesterase
VRLLLVNNRLIAHRGASAYAPENTFAAFERARQLGAQALECDVVLSSDGEPFIFHDNNLKRTSNGKGEIGLVNSDYLKTLNAGSWFSSRFSSEKIPLLKEVLTWAVNHDMSLNIEIKPFAATIDETVISVLSHINQYWPYSKGLPLVSSFEKKALMLCRSLSPELPLSLLVDDWDPACLSIAKDLDCYSINMNYKVLNHKRINVIKEAGFKLFAYTVNKKGMAVKLLDCGVDALFTDYPDLLS